MLRAAERFTLFVQWSPVTRFSNFCSAAGRGGLAVCQNSPLKTNGNCLEKYANFWCHTVSCHKTEFTTATGGGLGAKKKKGLCQLVCVQGGCITVMCVHQRYYCFSVLKHCVAVVGRHTHTLRCVPPRQASARFSRPSQSAILLPSNIPTISL